MELLIIGLVAGGVCGVGGKRLLKSAAKGYIVAAGKTKELLSSAQHNLRDAVEEARYELEEDEADEPTVPEPRKRRNGTRAAALRASEAEPNRKPRARERAHREEVAAE
jgi:hypothetical protein